jgi:hypothetical protein
MILSLEPVRAAIIEKKRKMFHIALSFTHRKWRHLIALLGFAMMAPLVLVGAKAAWGLYANYNRYNPLMDYVPQEIGFYDTTYWELSERDCRQCHGNSLATRHHATDTVILFGLCQPCHEEIPDPPGVVVIRDCTTSGCHSWEDIPVNGWHHDSQLADSENCSACHDPNLIGEITPFRDLATYPPTLVTPSPFSCENCHWEQPVVGSHWIPGDPEPDQSNSGHPSTYDHYNSWELFVGYHEYKKEIFGNFDTHHMGFTGSAAAQCWRCHANDPNDLSWDPYDPELIRYCEICHTVETLHTIAPHVQGIYGWEAVGFHVDDVPDPSDVAPGAYREMTMDEVCFACHGNHIPEPPPEPRRKPSIDASPEGIQPSRAACRAIVTLTGNHFGLEHAAGYEVQTSLRGDGAAWVDMPVYSWTNTRIEFKIPCWTMVPGNYRVRVVTPAGASNGVNLTIADWNSVKAVSPDMGACGEWITLTGVGFGRRRSKVFADNYTGEHRLVDFVSSEGTYTALKYKDWSDTNLKVRLKEMFQDVIHPETGHRNFVQDDLKGSTVEEPTITACDALRPGTYAVYVKTIFFGDDDGSKGLSPEDTIFQVVVSDPAYFELMALPTDEVPSRTNEVKKSGGDGGCFISTALEPTLRPVFRP